MKEVDKLQQLFNEWQASEMEKQKRQKDERQKREQRGVIIQKDVRKCIVQRAYLKLFILCYFHTKLLEASVSKEGIPKAQARGQRSLYCPN